MRRYTVNLTNGRKLYIVARNKASAIDCAKSDARNAHISSVVCRGLIKRT